MPNKPNGSVEDGPSPEAQEIQRLRAQLKDTEQQLNKVYEILEQRRDEYEAAIQERDARISRLVKQKDNAKPVELREYLSVLETLSDVCWDLDKAWYYEHRIVGKSDIGFPNLHNAARDSTTSAMHRVIGEATTVRAYIHARRSGVAESAIEQARRALFGLLIRLYYRMNDFREVKRVEDVALLMSEIETLINPNSWSALPQEENDRETKQEESN